MSAWLIYIDCTTLCESVEGYDWEQTDWCCTCSTACEKNDCIET